MGEGPSFPFSPETLDTQAIAQTDFLLYFSKFLASARRVWKAQISEKYYLYFLASNVFF